MKELNSQYHAANSSNERRNICIRLIDEGIIYRNCSVALIDQLFGTNYATDLPSEGDKDNYGFIYFEKQATHPEITKAYDYTGWYLAFTYNSKGKIQNYYLSNLHK